MQTQDAFGVSVISMKNIGLGGGGSLDLSPCSTLGTDMRCPYLSETIKIARRILSWMF